MKITIKLDEVDLRILRYLEARLIPDDNGSSSVTIEIDDIELDDILDEK